MSKENAIATIAEPRLPYHPGLQERFDIDLTSWRALVESTFPTASTSESVILALSYCRARNLDPFKRVVHIVPIWDKKRKCMVDTVWPGIAEYRTTAFRTGVYAGKDPTEIGPVIEGTVAGVTLSYPEWMVITIYRLVDSVRVAFPGPRVYWLETFGSLKDGAPNSMWVRRPFGMLEKCAEAAALRCAFPEELGGECIAEEIDGTTWHGRPARPRQDAEPVTAGMTPKLAAPTPTWDEADQPRLLAEYDELVRTADSIIEVDQYAESAVRDDTLSDDNRKRILDGCELRRSEIRDGRGEGSKEETP